MNKLADKYLISEGMSSLENFTNDEEILRAVMLAEADAANFYVQMASKCENEKTKKLLLDIAKEEDVHLYEAQTLLEMYRKDFRKLKSQAQDEVKALFNDIKFNDKW